MEIEKTPKRIGQFVCNLCDFRCSKKSDWTRHIGTRKHTMETIRAQNGTEKSAVILSCPKCSRVYQTRPGLWKHSQKCTVLETEIIQIQDCDTVIKSCELESKIVEQNHPDMLEDSTIPPEWIARIVSEVHKQLGISEILKNNQELIKIVKETNDTVARTVNHNTTTNTQNNQFNLSFFLNEKCKDAVNFTDFVNSIALNQDDLQTVVRHGHVD